MNGQAQTNSVNLWFVEICFDDLWTAVGIGHPTMGDAEWALSLWRQSNQCYKSGAFRVREHQMAAPPPYDLDDEWMELTADGKPIPEPMYDSLHPEGL